MTTDLITLPELEQYLAKAADLLRGSIDQADFKAYIFPLMFFKRISDVYLEEFAQALEESGGDHEFAAFAENHRFAIPEGDLWADVRSHTENIGTALQAAFREIEKANPETLYGIFGNANWTNKDKLPDRKAGRPDRALLHQDALQRGSAAGCVRQCVRIPHQTLRRSVEQEGWRVLHPALGGRPADQHPQPGRGRERLRPGLRHRWHADRGHRAREVRRRKPQDPMGQALRPGKGARHLVYRPHEPTAARRRGFQDRPRGHPPQPAFYTGNHLAQFDCVVANPPFSLKNWGDTEWATDKWGRNSLGGVPPKGYADWAWVQHMLTSARPKTGRVAVVLPQGALFRQGAEAKIRTHIVKSDVVDAVIGLAPNLFYGAGLAACVLILRLQKQPEEKGKVLFINGEHRYKRGRNQNTLEPEHAQQLLDAYELFSDIDGLARVVDLDEIAGNGYTLNIPLYVAPADTGEKVTLADALADLETAQAKVAETRGALESELAKWGLGVSA